MDRPRKKRADSPFPYRQEAGPIKKRADSPFPSRQEAESNKIRSQGDGGEGKDGPSEASIEKVYRVNAEKRPENDPPNLKLSIEGNIDIWAPDWSSVVGRMSSSNTRWITDECIHLFGPGLDIDGDIGTAMFEGNNEMTVVRGPDWGSRGGTEGGVRGRPKERAGPSVKTTAELLEKAFAGSSLEHKPHMRVLNSKDISPQSVAAATATGTARAKKNPPRRYPEWLNKDPYTARAIITRQAPQPRPVSVPYPFQHTSETRSGLGMCRWCRWRYQFTQDSGLPRKTKVWCKECNVPLCEGCFWAYHAP